MPLVRPQQERARDAEAVPLFAHLAQVRLGYLRLGRVLQGLYFFSFSWIKFGLVLLV